jgi:RHS repeat-associated protein
LEEGGLPLQTPASTSTFDADNQITSGGALGATFTNDPDGNRLTESSPSGNTGFTWDARGRLIAVLVGGVVTDFMYDYDGNLIQKLTVKTGGSTVEHYILDDLSNVVKQDKVDAGSVAILTGRRVDQTLAYVSGGTAVYPTFDILASTVALTSGAGTVTGNVYYEPFGKTTESGSTDLLEFTGRQQAVPDLYYLRARYLDVRNGRFISQDPMGIGGGDPDLYRYVNNNPVSYVDPSGQITGQFGVSFNVQLWGFNVQGFAGLAWDQTGNVGYYYGGGAGAGVGLGASAGFGVTGGASTGDSIKDLGGPFANYSGALGSGLQGTGDVFTGFGTKGQLVVGGGVTAGFGAGASSSTAVTETVVCSFFGGPCSR